MEQFAFKSGGELGAGLFSTHEIIEDSEKEGKRASSVRKTAFHK